MPQCLETHWASHIHEMNFSSLKKACILSKQVNFIKYFLFSVNYSPAQTFSHQLLSWHVVSFTRRNCWFGPEVSLMKSCIFEKMYTKPCFPKCTRNKQQKVISLLTKPIPFFCLFVCFPVGTLFNSSFFILAFSLGHPHCLLFFQLSDYF